MFHSDTLISSRFKTIYVLLCQNCTTKRRISLVPWGADDRREDCLFGAPTLGAVAVSAVSGVPSYVKLPSVGIAKTFVLR